MKRKIMALSLMTTALLTFTACDSADLILSLLEDDEGVEEVTSHTDNDIAASADTDEATDLPEENSGTVQIQSHHDNDLQANEDSDNSYDSSDNGTDNGSLTDAEYNPDITFSTYDVINKTDVDEDIFKGYKLTMVNFWEPWCGPCVSEMPDLEDLYEDLGSGTGDINIIGVYSTEEDAMEVLKMCGTTYPVLQYVSDFDSLQSGYVPNTVFFDGDGQIVESNIADYDNCLFVGSRSYDEWKQIIKELSK